MTTNKEIASKLREIATLLGEQKANPFRINAYLSAAKTIEAMSEPVEDLLRREGFSALLELPGIGDRNEAVICTPLEYNEKMSISLLFCWS